MKMARATTIRELVEVSSSVKGVVTRLLRRPGHSVKPLEDLLVVTEDDGQETIIQSSHTGIITTVYVKDDGTCRVGSTTVLMTIDISPNALQQLRDHENGRSAEPEGEPKEDEASVAAAIACADASSSPPRGNEVQYGAAAVPEGTRPLTITTTEIQPQRPRWPRESEAISDPTQKTSNLGFGCGEDEIEHCGPFQDREQIGD